METITIRTAQHVGIQAETAGLGDRVIAALLDYLVLGAYLLAIGLLAAITRSQVVFWILFLPAVLYFLLCELFMDGQSIGKRAREIKVVRLDGTAPRLGDYLLRWLLRPIDLWLFSGIVAVVSVLVSEKGQRLGDIVAGTTVVNAAPRVSLDDTVFTRLAETYTPTFPQAERLSAEDAETAREVLNVLVAEGKSQAAFALGERTKSVLQNKLQIESDLPPRSFLKTLLRDYNHFTGRAEF